LFDVCSIMKPVSKYVLFWSLNSLPAFAATQGYCVKTLAPIGGGPRQEHSVVAAGDNIYVVAGLRTSTIPRGDNFTSAVEVYNTINNTWSEVAPLPLAAHHTNVASVDGKVYYLGGLVSPGNSIFTSEATAKSYRYDPAVNKWEEIAPMPNARGSAAVGVYGKTIYLAGGLYPGMRSVDITSSYDTVTNKWTDHDALKLPEARDHAGSAVIDGIMYVVGGRVGANRGTVYALNLNSSSPKWVTKTPMPVARGGLAAASAGKKIYTFGGEGNRANAKGVFGDFAIYDTEKDSWETAAPMTAPRHGFGAASIGDKVYVPGGGAQQGGGSPLALNEVYGAC
jgi:N-acetylneuraminic acid mutarotase